MSWRCTTSPRKSVNLSLCAYFRTLTLRYQADGDLDFHAGDRIELVQRTASSEDWWTGKVNGRQGVFPGEASRGLHSDRAVSSFDFSFRQLRAGSMMRYSILYIVPWSHELLAKDIHDFMSSFSLHLSTGPIASAVERKREIAGIDRN